MSVETYTSNIEIPKEWIDEIEKCDDAKNHELLSRQKNEFIKKYYKIKKRADIARILCMNERSVYKKMRKLRERGEIE